MMRRGGNILKKCLVISSLLRFEIVHLFGGGQTNKHPKKKHVLLTLYLFRYHYISFRMATHWLRPCKNWGPNSGTPWRHQSKHGQNNVMHRSLDAICFGRGMYNTTTSAWWNYMTKRLGNKCTGIVTLHVWTNDNKALYGCKLAEMVTLTFDIRTNPSIRNLNYMQGVFWLTWPKKNVKTSHVFITSASETRNKQTHP